MADGVGRRALSRVVTGAMAVSAVGVVSMPVGEVQAAGFTVVDVGDASDVAPGNGVCETIDGVCTLRAALEEANASPGRDTVSFAIPGGGVQQIVLTAELPTLIDPAGTIVDGYTQPGSLPNSAPFAFDATINLELVGGGPAGIDGFVINGPNNVIRGFSIYDFRRGIRLFGTEARDNEIVGNLLGTDTTGTFASDEYVRGSMAVNIQAGANNNSIGMPGDANRNVISGNYQHGVALYDNDTVGNRIQNNLIGFTPDGTGPLPNRGHGVDINTWASETLVGGPGEQERNVIAATGQSGVEISHGPGTLGNRVIGNWIGTGVDGTSAPEWAAITQFGVNLEGVAVCDLVCEPDMADAVVTDNVIVNATGGVILHKATFGNIVADNKIGVLPDGTPAPHTVFGVRIEKGAFDNVIGPGNEIAYSPNGLQLVPDGTNPESLDLIDTTGNTFTQNSIHDNGGLGIDLYPLGSVTTQPLAIVNGGAVTPVVTSTTSSSARVSACVGCTVELFRSDGLPDVFGEGIEYLGSAVVPASGSVKLQLPASVHESAVTATSTTAGGSTSEFSNGRLVPPASPSNLPPLAGLDVSCDVTVCTFDATASTDDDGTIEWYEWDFGDGATLTTDGPIASHDYRASGSFGVTVTIIDSDAATDSTSAFADPFNLAPSADFSVACDLQLCSFASDAVDPDGEIATWAWDFGGLGADDVAAPTFVFPGGGTFVVTQTVTDNSGTSATSRQAITVSPFPNGLVALDGFNRDETNGWGLAPMGGPWSYPIDNQQDFSVVDHRGVISIDAVAGLRSTSLAEVAQRDVTVTATVSTDVDPTGWGLTSYVAARQVDARTEYRARMRQSGSGSVYLALVKTVGNSSQITIGTEVLVPGLSSAADTDLRVSLAVAGVSPTTLRAKVWDAGQVEPVDWTIVETDDEPALQQIGAIAVGAAPGSSHTALPVRYRFDDVQVVADNDPPVAAIDADCVNTACAFSALGSTDPDGSLVFYSWDFGDGASVTGAAENQPQHTYADFGTYDVTLTVTDDKGGSGSITVPVEVANALPVPVIGWSCDELTCSFTSTGSLDPDGLIVGYEWNFADGTTSSEIDPTHTFAVSDIYTVTLTVTDDDDGEDTATISIEPTLAPTADFTHTCDLTTCIFDASPSSDPDGTVVGFAWDFGDGVGVGDGAAPGYAFPGGGPYDVTLTVTDNLGAMGSVTLPVDPNAPPTPIIVYDCDDTDCEFDGTTSVDTDGTVVAYAWDFGDGNTSTDPAPAQIYPSNGTFTVTLTVTDDEGGIGVLAEDVGISATPVATFAVSCELLECTVDGTGSFDPDGTEVTYTWDFGDGATASGRTATHLYADGDPRTISLQVTDESGSIGNASEAIDPNAPPTPLFDATCDGLSCSFDASASFDDVGIASYAWNFGDGATGVGENVSYTYATKADYDVVLTVADDEGVERSVTVVVVPNSPPTAAFAVSCPSLTCEFDASTSVDSDGTVVSYTWDFGDGATGAGETVSHTYAELGDQIVTLVVTDDDGAAGSSTATATPNELPVAAFTIDCVVNTCTVDATASSDPDGVIAEYSWAWGDGTDSTGVTASHTYDTVLPTEVELTVTDDDGGMSAATEPISLTRVIAADGFGRATQNSWGAADLGGTWTLFGGGGLGRAFSTDGAEGVIEVPTVGSGRSARLLGVFGRDVDVSATFRTDSAATGFGQYVALIGRRSGTNLEYRARVRISSSGQFFVGAAKLIGTSSEQLIGGEEPVEDLTHEPGTDYRVRAQFDGADPTTIRIRIWAADTPEPGEWALVRTDDQVQMQSGGSIGVNVGLSSSAVVAPVTFTFDDVEARLVGDAPGGTIAIDCAGLDCTYDAAGVTDPDGTIETYEWDLGDGATATGPVAAHTYALGGPKAVVLRVVDNEGAVAEIAGAADPFGPNQDPTAAFTVDCLAETCAFDGGTSTDPDGTVVAYAWDFGDGTVDDGANPTHAFAAAGTYTVTLTITDDRDGTDTTMVDVAVVDAIAADAFERVVVDGLGTADVGGDWTTSGGAGATSFGVDGTATIDVPSPATGRSMRLLDVAAQDIDVRALIRSDLPATGYGQFVSLIGRHQGTNLEYRARVRFHANGIFLGAVKNVNSSSEIVIDGEERVDGIDHTAGQWYRLRMQLDGDGTTTFRIKLWADGAPEPLEWDLVRTDDQAELQAPGGVGANVALSGSATNAPVVFELDDLAVRPVGAVPVPAFTVDCTGLSCDVDASTTTDPDGVIVSYEWDFGDGTTATGVTASHTYAFGGDKNRHAAGHRRRRRCGRDRRRRDARGSEPGPDGRHRRDVRRARVLVRRPRVGRCRRRDRRVRVGLRRRLVRHRRDRVAHVRGSRHIRCRAHRHRRR